MSWQQLPPGSNYPMTHLPPYSINYPMTHLPPLSINYHAISHLLPYRINYHSISHPVPTLPSTPLSPTYTPLTPPLQVGSGREADVLERLRSELSHRLERAGLPGEPASLHSSLRAVFGLTLGDSPALPPDASSQAYLYLVATCELARNKLGPLPSPGEPSPLAAALGYVQMCEEGGSLLPWLCLLVERCFVVYVARLMGMKQVLRVKMLTPNAAVKVGGEEEGSEWVWVCMGDKLSSSGPACYCLPAPHLPAAACIAAPNTCPLGPAQASLPVPARPPACLPACYSPPLCLPATARLSACHCLPACLLLPACLAWITLRPLPVSLTHPPTHMYWHVVVHSLCVLNCNIIS